MRIGLLTGPFVRGQCGVGDYTDLLAEALNAKGIEARVIDTGDWRLLKSHGLIRALQFHNFDLIHIQYPTIGFGAKLSPQALALIRRCVITIHEASQTHPLRRLALFPFSVRPRHVIFLSNFEREFGIRWAPWISSISSVVPSASNIRRFTRERPLSVAEIVSFGLIRPGNAHGTLLEFAALLKNSGLALSLRIIGSPQSAKFIPYFDELRRKSVDLPIIWDCGLTEIQVAERLAIASLAYLPYPGGASELRASLKATLVNGLAVVTTRGPQTPESLDGVVKFADTPQKALETIRCLMNDAPERQRLGRCAREYVRDWTWERTAEIHEAIYRGLLGGSGTQLNRSEHSFALDPDRNKCT